MTQITEALITLLSSTVWIPWVVLTTVIYRYHRGHRSNPMLTIVYCSISLTIALFFQSLSVLSGNFGYNSILYIKLFSIFNLLGVLFWMRLVIRLVNPNHKEWIILQFVYWLFLIGVESVIIGDLCPLADIMVLHDVSILSYLIVSFSVSSFFLIRLNQRIRNRTLKRHLKMLIAGTLFPLLIHFFADTYAANWVFPTMSPFFAAIFAWIFGLLIYFGVVFRGEEILKLFSFEGTISLDPTIRDCRVYALLTDYTSPEGTCKFYDDGLRSKCRLDPLVFRRDCRGIVFIEGFVCHQIRYHVDKERSR